MDFKTSLIKIGQEIRKLWLFKDFETADWRLHFECLMRFQEFYNY